MSIKIRGIIPPMITPFDQKEKVDRKTLQKMTNYLIEAGVHGVFPLGSTGEGYALSFEEKREIIETVIETTNKRVPVYAGTGAITTKDSIKLTKMATELGVDALSVITPYFISPNQEELFEHYKAIAASTELPIILYNNPGRTGIDLSIDLIVRLSEIENIVGIKDSSGDMTKAAEIIRRTTGNFAVLSGRDTLIYGFLAYGGHGSVAATANIVPELVVSIYELFQKGEYQAALEAQFKLAPLRMAFSLGSFPVIMKEGLKLKGIEVGNTLAPVKPLSPEARDKLKKIIEEIEK
ncbi:MAG: 4-hydroxy-tetrahydrodipicolinate synthase [Candidatus Caldatribacteriota bacterium]